MQRKRAYISNSEVEKCYQAKYKQARGDDDERRDDPRLLEEDGLKLMT